jgi:hypothetical protein
MDWDNPIAINPPLAGEWKFLRPPGHHPYAFDFVQTDASRKRYHKGRSTSWYFSGIASDKYCCWEKPIYAPVAGEIVRVGDDWLDHEYTSFWRTIRIWYEATYRFRPQVVEGRLDIRPNAGNHVMIKTDEGFIVFLAHVRNHSLTVMEGQRIKTGQLIGKVGNSGNSTAPHLHINLFDQITDPYRSKVLPFVFSHYERLCTNGAWKNCRLSVPEKGAYVRFGQVQLN